eukprot:NODE_10776_length_1330_cov_3.182045.p3 GENE.NODE_10776_length_1330_cov_3.182045~~NODE_10776_length_1330_cov_3.182045.p3  ORF type:complete len:131 (+),score=22.93 NODE_10776_length_1330_cov_3.182045:198-590(+)
MQEPMAPSAALIQPILDGLDPITNEGPENAGILAQIAGLTEMLSGIIVKDKATKAARRLFEVDGSQSPLPMQVGGDAVSFKTLELDMAADAVGREAVKRFLEARDRRGNEVCKRFRTAEPRQHQGDDGLF